MSQTSILIYGRTGAGKSAQLGVLAEYIFTTTKKKTRIYTADGGGIDTFRPYINLGLVDVIEIEDTNPWLFASKASRGYIRDANRKWVLDKAANAQLGCVCIESTHSLAKLMKQDMERSAAKGLNVGGDTNSSFSVKDEASGEEIKIGTTKGFQKFALPQGRVLEELQESKKLPVEIVAWTAGVDKDDDDINGTIKIVGPSVVGKALTTTLPQEVSYTFRMDVIPAQAGKPERHLLYLGQHTDVNAGNALALGNIRRPLDATPMRETIIEPASIAVALKMVRDDAVSSATEAIRKRLGL